MPVGPVETANIIRLVEKELGSPVAELLTEFTTEPLASASIAQVHRALLHDGRGASVQVMR